MVVESELHYFTEVAVVGSLVDPSMADHTLQADIPLHTQHFVLSLQTPAAEGVSAGQHDIRFLRLAHFTVHPPDLIPLHFFLQLPSPSERLIYQFRGYWLATHWTANAFHLSSQTPSGVSHVVTHTFGGAEDVRTFITGQADSVVGGQLSERGFDIRHANWRLAEETNSRKSGGVWVTGRQGEVGTGGTLVGLRPQEVVFD